MNDVKKKAEEYLENMGVRKDSPDFYRLRGILVGFTKSYSYKIVKTAANMNHIDLWNAYEQADRKSVSLLSRNHITHVQKDALKMLKEFNDV